MKLSSEAVSVELVLAVSVAVAVAVGEAVPAVEEVVGVEVVEPVGVVEPVEVVEPVVGLEPEADGLGDGDVEGVGDEPVVLPVLPEPVLVGVGDVEGDDELVGGGDVVVVVTCAGSHSLLCPATTAEVTPAGLSAAVPVTPGVYSAAEATPKLVAETTRKPPAARLTAGRTCAKRMKALPVLFVALAERGLGMEWLHQACNHRFANVLGLFTTKPTEKRHLPTSIPRGSTGRETALRRTGVRVNIATQL